MHVLGLNSAEACGKMYYCRRARDLEFADLAHTVFVICNRWGWTELLPVNRGTGYILRDQRIQRGPRFLGTCGLVSI